MTNPDIRAAFEYWFSDEGAHPKAIERSSSGGYILAAASSAWNAWQACAASLSNSVAVGELPKLPEPIAQIGKFMDESTDVFDGSQMRAYGQQCAEAARQPAPVAPALTVWEGAMPESNGKSNFTAVLHRKSAKGFDVFEDGFTIAKSEYPGRVRYEADCVRYLIGELTERPCIINYDADTHSGYVEPDRAALAATAAPVLLERSIRTWRERCSAYAIQHMTSEAREAIASEIADLRSALAAIAAPVVLDDSQIKMIAYGHRIGSEVAVKFARAILAATRSQP